MLLKTCMVWVGLKAPGLKWPVSVIIAFEEAVDTKAKKALNSEILIQVVK